ncbi:hypothetical protein E3Q13_00743 [Wallemia mellicola]|nr:hypothetical protein E3Q13_00743 [Wallemia mellicola]
MNLAVVILLVVACAALQSFGLTVQRKSHIENYSSQWIVGFTIYLVFNILGTIIQLASLPLIVLAPLGAISLIPNIVFARLLLKDKRRELVQGIILICIGATLIAYHSDLSPDHLSYHQLMKLFSKTNNEVYLALQVVVIGATILIGHLWEHKRDTSVAEASPLLESAKSHKRNGPAVLFASSSGILSGFCLLLAKGGIDVLSKTIIKNGKWKVLLHWQIWLLIAVLVVSAVLQLWYLNRALKLADPSLICPLAFCFYNVSSILNGLVFFKQYTHTSKTDLLTITAGTTVLLTGVWIISLNESLKENTGVESTDNSDTITEQHSPPISPTIQQGFSIGISANSPNFTTQHQSRQNSLLGTITSLFKNK